VPGFVLQQQKYKNSEIREIRAKKLSRLLCVLRFYLFLFFNQQSTIINHQSKASRYIILSAKLKE
jgi:hypothetical protein